MATVVVNEPDLIEFKNVSIAAPVKDAPTLVIQSGKWETDDSKEETGIVFDVAGNNAPLLTPADARKLARWLTKAADSLEGLRQDKKKSKPQQWDDESGDDEY